MTDKYTYSLRLHVAGTGHILLRYSSQNPVGNNLPLQGQCTMTYTMSVVGLNEHSQCQQNNMPVVFVNNRFQIVC